MSVSIQKGDFDIGAECDALSILGGNVGAMVTFTGLVRGDDGLLALTLEHYEGMTEQEIERHVAAARERWPLLGVRIIHRVGRLVPGERIVFVGATSAHRQAAFEAAEFLMDYLKTRAPFWKLEERTSGSTWVEPRASDSDATQRWKKD